MGGWRAPILDKKTGKPRETGRDRRKIHEKQQAQIRAANKALRGKKKKK